MTKKRADRDVKSVAFSLVDVYEAQLYAHAMTKGKFSAYVKRLIDRDMQSGGHTPPPAAYIPPPIPSYTPPVPAPEPSPPPVTQSPTKPFIVPKAAASGFAGMY